jgi:nicotinate phosphoribosyltransferase
MDFTAQPGHALLTDLYELTMMQAYLREGRTARAVFSLFPRSLPPGRNYFIACGLDDALSYLEHLRFTPASIAYLRGVGGFAEPFLAWLAGFSFSGDVRAVPEGTPMFPGEPLLEISAPLPEAQLVETMLVNRLHAQTLAASKCARVVRAAGGRAVVDFGLRRMHGTEAAVKNARAYAIAGAAATSNVLAGATYGLEVSGTMAHSYVQSHDTELAAFRAFTALYPETVLLVDTYDTMTGVENVIRLAREMGEAFRVKAIRLDSGDLAALSRAARARLDQAGLTGVSIFASGNLDEYSITDLLARGAAIDGFGVGTRLGVSTDAPSLDFCYKLCSYAGRDRVKLATGKQSLPGPQQVFRLSEAGPDGERDVADILAGDDEHHPGRPLLVPVMRDGVRLDGHGPAPDPAACDATDIAASARRAREGLQRLSPALLTIADAAAPYPVRVSPALLARRQRIAESLA